MAARGTIQLFVARGCVLVGGYIIAVTLARGLGPADYGVYGVIMSVLVWLELASTSGIPAATSKLIPEYQTRAPEVEQTAMAFLLAVSLALLILCWVLAPSLAHLFHIEAGINLFRIAILDLPLYGVYNAYQAVLNGHRQFGTLSVGMITYSLTKVGGILLLLLLGLSISGALVVNVFATVGALVYIASRVPLKRVWPAYSLLVPMLRLALPYGLAMAAVQVLLNLDLWSLKSMWTDKGEVIGMYVASLNISRMMTVVPTVLAGVLFASLCWALARKNEVLAQNYIQAAMRFTLVVLAPCCLLMIQHAEDLMSLLYSSVYRPGGAYLRLQVIAFGLFAMFDLLGNALGAAGNYYRALSTVIFLIPVELILNRLLIPQFGGMGAAGSVALTMCIGICIMGSVAYYRFGPLIKLPTLLRVVVASALIALLSKQLTVVGSWLLVKFVVLLAGYVLMLALLGELKGDDLKGFAFWDGDSRGEEDGAGKQPGIQTFP